jgi:hypothetical protein
MTMTMTVVVSVLMLVVGDGGVIFTVEKANVSLSSPFSLSIARSSLKTVALFVQYSERA